MQRSLLLLSAFVIGNAFAFIPERPFPSVESPLALFSFEKVGPRYTEGLPLDPDFSKQWWIYNQEQTDADGQVGFKGADIHLLEALKSYQPQKEVVLAIIDSGLDLKHEDIDSDNLWVNQAEANGLPGVDDDRNGYIDDIHGWNMVHQTPDIQDNLYHGTHVGGLISAISNNDKGIFGRVPGIKIMIVKIWDKGGDIFASHVGEAVRYACANGAQILSNSYGTPSANQETKEAIEFCHERGALFVGAAGNSGQNLDLTPDYPSSFGIENQLVVGASDNQDDRALFSNYGNTVELFAPGKDIFSLTPNNRYKVLSGTSQACPLVALSAAMLLAQYPEMSWQELKETLIKSGDEFTRLAKWSKNGRRINLANALLKKEGRRLNDYSSAQWSTTAVELASPHPYPRRTVIEKNYIQEGATRLRLHFAQFELSNYDTVVIRNGKGEIVERYNGELLPFWSQVIEGDRVSITLTSGSSPLKFGYQINQVEYAIE